MTRQPCGTPAAYLRHTRHGEPPCDPCRHAWNTYYRARRAAKKSAKSLDSLTPSVYHEGMTNTTTTTATIHDAIYELRMRALRAADHPTSGDHGISWGDLGNPDHDWYAEVYPDNSVVVWAAGDIVARDYIDGAWELIAR